MKIVGIHTYAKFGFYDITVVVTDVGGSVITLTPTSEPRWRQGRSDRSHHIGVPANFTAVEGINTGTIVLATIDNGNPVAVSQLVATVNWGNGARDSTATVVLVGATATESVFQITGSHTYAEEGTFPVTLTALTTEPIATTFMPATGTATVVDARSSRSGASQSQASQATRPARSWSRPGPTPIPGATVAD